MSSRIECNSETEMKPNQIQPTSYLLIIKVPPCDETLDTYLYLYLNLYKFTIYLLEIIETGNFTIELKKAEI